MTSKVGLIEGVAALETEDADRAESLAGRLHEAQPAWAYRVYPSPVFPGVGRWDFLVSDLAFSVERVGERNWLLSSYCARCISFKTAGATPGLRALPSCHLGLRPDAATGNVLHLSLGDQQALARGSRHSTLFEVALRSWRAEVEEELDEASTGVLESLILADYLVDAVKEVLLTFAVPSYLGLP